MYRGLSRLQASLQKDSNSFFPFHYLFVFSEIFIDKLLEHLYGYFTVPGTVFQYCSIFKCFTANNSNEETLWQEGVINS